MLVNGRVYCGRKAKTARLRIFILVKGFSDLELQTGIASKLAFDISFQLLQSLHEYLRLADISDPDVSCVVFVVSEAPLSRYEINTGLLGDIFAEFIVIHWSSIL